MRTQFLLVWLLILIIMYSQGINKFLEQDGMEELAKYKLNESEWKALELFQSIPLVNNLQSICGFD